MARVRLQIHQIVTRTRDPKQLLLILDKTMDIHHLAETIMHVEMPCSSNAAYPAHYLFTLIEVRDEDSAAVYPSKRVN